MMVVMMAKDGGDDGGQLWCMVVTMADGSDNGGGW